jgi:hypothetical protein
VATTADPHRIALHIMLSTQEVAADKSRAEVDEEVRRLTADRKRLLSQNRCVPMPRAES